MYISKINLRNSSTVELCNLTWMNKGKKNVENSACKFFCHTEFVFLQTFEDITFTNLFGSQRKE